MNTRIKKKHFDREMRGYRATPLEVAYVFYEDVLAAYADQVARNDHPDLAKERKHQLQYILFNEWQRDDEKIRTAKAWRRLWKGKQK